MCGIAGAVGNDAASLTRLMVTALSHRGPDDEGHYQANGAALGFRRLSIVDLAGGAQPIRNETGDVVLICNGEIYNSPALRRQLLQDGHKFRTNSDVEVILHLYEDHGEACVRMLRGMFAFAIWDERNRSLLLAKDHMGQKPLFYYRDGNRLLFASEINAILASGVVPRRLDESALWHYVSLRSMPDEYSLIQGIHKLPAATTMVIRSDGSSQTQRYWNPDFTRKQRLTDREAEEALDDCLRETVASHLLSDVPVGTFLSGGIDSGTIGVMMSRQSRSRIPAFCIGVPEVGFDELPIAEQVASAERMEFHGARVKSDIAALVPLMTWHLGEPADPYAVGMYLASRLAASHVKVALSGDGGDESFGGYDRYLGQRLVDLYCALPAIVRKQIMPRLMARIPETFQYKSMAQRLSWMQSMAGLNGGHRYAQALGFLRFTPEERDQLFQPQVAASIEDRDTVAKVLRYYDSPNIESMIDRMLYTDVMTRVPDHNLVMTDRMSMACSLEVRSPFVDKNVVEFAASLPASMKIRRLTLKYLLRRVARRYLPPGVTRRSKQGFGFPVGIWLRTELRPLVEQRLSQSHLVEAGIFEPRMIQRLLKEHMAGSVDHNYRLWLLLNLEIWYELYILGRSHESVQSDTKELTERASSFPQDL